VKGKVKESLRRGLRWFKRKCSRILSLWPPCGPPPLLFGRQQLWHMHSSCCRCQFMGWSRIRVIERISVPKRDLCCTSNFFPPKWIQIAIATVIILVSRLHASQSPRECMPFRSLKFIIQLLVLIEFGINQQFTRFSSTM
jgi:hypothetical protein